MYIYLEIASKIDVSDPAEILKEGILMFSIKKVEMINKTFRFPEDMLHELEVLAQNNNVSMNNLVVQCCRYALDNLSTDEKPAPPSEK